MKYLEKELEEIGEENLIDAQLYRSSGWSETEALKIRMRDGEKTDCVTGLKQKTCYGRPDWNQLFDKYSLEYRN